MRFTLAVVVSALLATPAAAQEVWYARGSFNNFDTTLPMVDSGDGVFFTRTVDGLFAETDYTFKVANEDYSEEAPPGFEQDIKVRSTADLGNGTGEININFWDIETWDDGWEPNDQRRIGYVDHGLFDWEIMSSANGFTDPLLQLTDQGNGLHTGTLGFDAGIYQFKFRQQGDWNTNIGDNGFSNNAGNNTFVVATDGDEWNFELDLPNGRWRAFTDAVPPVTTGDHNQDGSVDAADYVVWRHDPASHGGPQGYTDWRANFGESSGPTGWVAIGPQIAQTQLIDQGGGDYTATLSGLAPSTDFELRVSRPDLSEVVPGSNAKIRANASGEINLNFYELAGASWGDGWSPDAAHRVGYVDHDEFDWEIMGSFNGFTAPVVQLTDQGSGLHTGTFVIDVAGTYDFKFRQQGDWNTSIGADFGNAAPNATLTTTADSELWHFELDLPNGRWRTYADGAGASVANVPEPSTFAVALVTILAAGLCRRGDRLGA